MARDKDKQKAAQKRWREKNKVRTKEYDRRYRAENANRIRRRRKAYYLRNRERMAAYDRSYSKNRRSARRQKTIALLGGKCIRCGFDDWRALQVDHINGGGTRERLSTNSMDKYYRDILEAPPGKYQLLCANCNQIKRYETDETRK
jgi:hypothetical protein